MTSSDLMVNKASQVVLDLDDKEELKNMETKSDTMENFQEHNGISKLQQTHVEKFEDVDVTDATVTVRTKEDPDKFYPMTGSNNGYALIISNSFRGCKTATELNGAKHTFEYFRSLFSGLGYVVVTPKCEDLTYVAMAKKIEDFVALDHSSMRSCVVAISSHGTKDHIYTPDDQHFPVDGIIEQFSNEKCPSLKGKPKLFFIDACRGNKHYMEFDFVDTGELTNTLEDIWIGYSSEQEFVSYTDPKGSFFTKTVATVFAEHACHTSLKELYKKVREELKKVKHPPPVLLYGKEPLKWTQNADSKEYGFTRDLYFNPQLLKTEEKTAKSQTEERRVRL